MITFIHKLKMKACCGFKFHSMHIFCKTSIASRYHNYLTSGFYISLKATMSWLNMLKGIHKNTSLPQKDAKIYSLLAVWPINYLSKFSSVAKKKMLIGFCKGLVKILSVIHTEYVCSFQSKLGVSCQFISLILKYNVIAWIYLSIQYELFNSKFNWICQE